MIISFDRTLKKYFAIMNFKKYSKKLYIIPNKIYMF